MPSLPPVVICAPGRSAIAWKLGKLIDSFDTVVRFQMAEQFTGAEDYVGRRTDICAFNGSLDAVVSLEKSIMLFKERGTIPEFFWTPSFMVQERTQWVDGAMRHYGVHYTINSLERIAALQKTLGMEGHYPSSGLVVIDHFLTKYEQVAIAGYDLVDPTPNCRGYSYYWDLFDRQLAELPHSLMREAAYVRALIASGKVKLVRELAGY